MNREINNSLEIDSFPCKVEKITRAARIAMVNEPESLTYGHCDI